MLRTQPAESGIAPSPRSIINEVIESTLALLRDDHDASLFSSEDDAATDEEESVQMSSSHRRGTQDDDEDPLY